MPAGGGTRGAFDRTSSSRSASSASGELCDGIKPPEEPVAAVRQKLVGTFAAAAALRSEPRCRNARTPATGVGAVRSAGLSSCLQAPVNALRRGAAANIVRRLVWLPRSGSWSTPRWLASTTLRQLPTDCGPGQTARRARAGVGASSAGAGRPPWPSRKSLPCA